LSEGGFFHSENGGAIDRELFIEKISVRHPRKGNIQKFSLFYSKHFNSEKTRSPSAFRKPAKFAGNSKDPLWQIDDRIL
jgi:hypothetical protein